MGNPRAQPGLAVKSGSVGAAGESPKVSRPTLINTLPFENKVLALIATGTSAKGEEETAVFTGTVRRVGQNLVFDRGQGAQFSIPYTWYERIKVVAPSVKEILLGAEFCISLSVGNIAEDDDLSTFESMGLKWPNQDP
jgi:hypothetical protein